MAFVSCEYKEFQFEDNRVVLDIQRNKLFQVDELASHILQSHTGKEDELVSALPGGHSPQVIREAWEELRRSGLIREDGEELAVSAPSELPPVGTLCLNVIHDCNLRCSYCYGRGGQYGTPGASMSYSTAVRALEYLLAQLPAERGGGICFFGGEPLLRWDLLQKIIPYIRQREAEERKSIRISIITNGTLLTVEKISLLRRHRVVLTLSLDGPPHIHDRVRVFPNGNGSYKVICQNIRELVRSGVSFSARATLDADEPHLVDSIQHLLQVGTRFVHAEPASGLVDGETEGLSTQALERLRKESTQLKEIYIKTIQTDSKLLPVFGFVRMLSMLTGSEQRRCYGCGMGRTYLAVSPYGELYPCHRFVDQREHLLGDLSQGLSVEARQRFVALHVDRREECRHCWARYLCGGGCYYEAFLTQGDFEHPDPTRCELAREIVADAIEIGTYLNHVPPHEIEEMMERLRESASYR
jgi:uncharacterized protein